MNRSIQLTELSCTLFSTGKYSSREEASRIAKTQIELEQLKRSRANEEKPDAKSVTN